MGVINVTPDSFSDGGQFGDPAAAIAHGRALLAEGADWLDVGGESTRPGAMPVSELEELRRVVPVVEALADDGARVSIDTRKPAVARAAVAAGASLLNDVGAANGAVAAELGVAWAAMHIQGEPATMQDDPRYDDVVAEVLDALVARAEAATRGRRARGVDRSRHRLRQDVDRTTSPSWPTSTSSSRPASRSWWAPAARASSGRSSVRLTAPPGPFPSTTGWRDRSPPPPGP